MPRKVLITFLGTGPLKKANDGQEISRREYRTMPYKIENEEYERSFVADALTDHYGIDTVIMIGTVKSMWEEVYRVFCEKHGKELDENIYLDLAESSSKASYTSELSIPHKEKIEEVLGKNSHISLIKYGLSDSELDYNISTILSLEKFLQSGDELYVDVTHSFRSMPLLLMNTLIYLQNISKKKVKIVGILYGMSEMISELKYAPIVNLKKALEVNNWISGAYSFSEFGNAQKICELLQDIDKSASCVLIDFTDANNLNNMVALQNSVQRLKSINLDNLPAIAKMTVTPVVKDFIQKIGNPNSTSEFQFNLAVWHRERKQYYAAYLTLVEAIVSYVCEICLLNETSRDDRDTAKKNINSKNSSYFQDHPEFYILNEAYLKLNSIRRRLAHSLPLDRSNESLIRTLNESISSLRSIWR